MIIIDILRITNEEEYEQVLKRIDEIFDAVPDTPEGDELAHLTRIVTDYEDIYYPI